MCCSKVGEWESFDDFCAVLVGTDRVSQRLEMEINGMNPGAGPFVKYAFFFFLFRFEIWMERKGAKRPK